MEFDRRIVAKFQEQDCQLTLGEAIEEFYQVNAHIFSKPDPTTPWTELLVTHDVGHVFFGVNTTIIDETAGDFWTILGTDMKLRDYFEYTKTPEAKQLLKDIGLLRLLKALIYSVPLFVTIFFRTRKMTKLWDHKNYQQHLNRKLDELRAEYNLRIL